MQLSAIFSTDPLALIKIWLFCIKCTLECCETVLKLAAFVVHWKIDFSWLKRKSSCSIKMIHPCVEYKDRQELRWNKIEDSYWCKREKSTEWIPLVLNVSLKFFFSSSIISLALDATINATLVLLLIHCFQCMRKILLESSQHTNQVLLICLESFITLESGHSFIGVVIIRWLQSQSIYCHWHH